MTSPNPSHLSTQREYQEVYGLQKIRTKYFPTNCFNCHYSSLVPALQWLPHYECSNLWLDLKAGFTVAVLQVPQGMAYAALGGVHPIVGIYMAIFPALVYVLLGTSRHISVGSFAIVCLMASKPVLRHTSPSYPAEDVATTVCLTVGLFQVLLGICKVGKVSMFMSEVLVSGFTNGAAVLVVLSQLPYVFGIKVQSRFGLFSGIYTTMDLLQELHNVNFHALAMSSLVVLFLFMYSNVLLHRFKCRITLPGELISLFLGTCLSYAFDFNSRYNITIVGEIPLGIPSPKIPRLFITDILLDGFIIAIISFSIQISLANYFAIKDGYKIRPNQEFLASGLSNVFGSLFCCLPLGTSLCRSVVQYEAGGKTQLTSLFSSIFLLSVVLFWGNLLAPLPYAVLAGVVIKNLSSMLLQFLQLPTVWRQSTVDGILWLVTFLTVILVNVEVGLGVALLVALLSVVLVGQKVQVLLLGHCPDSPQLYLEVKSYPAAIIPTSLLIVRIRASLHFANAHVAVNKLDSLLEESRDCRILIVDLSTVNFIDPSALQCLRNYFSLLSRRRPSLVVCIASCPPTIYQQMSRCDFFTEFSEERMFMTIHDAYLYASN